jgi:hypothetical protein
MTFEQVMKKADFAVSNLQTDGGYLAPIQANTFLRMVQEEPTILNQIRVVPMNGPTMEINKIGFRSHILRAAPGQGKALLESERSTPTTDQITLTSKKFLAEVQYPYDVLEDSIERDALEDTIMEGMSAKISEDLEWMLINADTETVVTDNDTKSLSMLDGILKMATTHTAEFLTPPTVYTRKIFKAGLLAMPNKYKANRRKLICFCSPTIEMEYADTLAGRFTQMGDTRTEAEYQGLLSAFGMPIASAGYMPDANYLITPPKNIIMGVQRQIMVETTRDIRTQQFIVVMSLRIDFVFEEEDAVVKATGLVAA